MNHLEKSEWLDDWFVVEGAPFGQPEGTADEWRGIIALMRERKSGQPGRRVGVVMRDDGLAQLYSPRNSLGAHDCAVVLGSELEEWITAAERTLTGEANDLPSSTGEEVG